MLAILAWKDGRSGLEFDADLTKEINFRLPPTWLMPLRDAAFTETGEGRSTSLGYLIEGFLSLTDTPSLIKVLKRVDDVVPCVEDLRERTPT